jgi:hypothetical protein
MCDAIRSKPYVTAADIATGNYVMTIAGPWPPPTTFTDERGVVWENVLGIWYAKRPAPAATCEPMPGGGKP